MNHRGALVMCAFAVACKSDPGPTKLAERVPVVTTEAPLLATTERVPPVLVLMKADGTLAVADAPRTSNGWEVLSTKAPKTDGQAIDASLIGPLVRESAELGVDIERRAKDAAKMKPDDLKLIEEDERLSDEDPPPPEPEDDEAYDDDSGGTGTAMALEEGKMGKKDSDRATGQYKMRRNNADPSLARQQALDAARSAGVLGQLADIHGSGSGSGISGGFGDLGGQAESDWPRRLGDVVGSRAGDGDREAHALIVAAPATKATAVIDVMAAVGPSFIAVSHQGKLRALRIGFGIAGRGFGFGGIPTEDTWVEVRVGPEVIAVEAVPGKPSELPWAKGPLDAAALGRAYTEATGKLGDRKDVDVLVSPDTDLQRVVDVIVALDAAGAEVVSLGRIAAAGTPEAGKRGKPIVRTRIGQPQSVGDLDKAIIRRYIKRSLPKITHCYEQALLVNPDLAGTVMVQFFIAPDGTVATASATGVTDEVASCVAGVIKAIEFPKPKGGGGVQVNYPFTFRT